MRRVSVFGATGSVGESTFDLLMRAGGPEAFHTVALSEGRNVARLAEMARALRAEVAVCADEGCLPALREALAGSGIAAASGVAAVHDAACRPADWVMSAIVGAAGLQPGLCALRQGATLSEADVLAHCKEKLARYKVPRSVVFVPSLNRIVVNGSCQLSIWLIVSKPTTSTYRMTPDASIP